MEITKDTLIFDIIRIYPDAIPVFNKYNMGCTSCVGMQKESLEKASLMHGLDLDELITSLKRVIL